MKIKEPRKTCETLMWVYWKLNGVKQEPDNFLIRQREKDTRKQAYTYLACGHPEEVHSGAATIYRVAFRDFRPTRT